MTTTKNAPSQLIIIITFLVSTFFSVLAPSGGASGQEDVLLPPRAGVVRVPLPRLEGLEPAVREQLSSFNEGWAALAGRARVTEAELASAYGSLGQVYHVYEFTETAEACYLNAHRLASQDSRWPHLLATLYEKDGRLSEAALYYQAARAIRPNYIASTVKLGSVYLQQNALAPARREFEQALGLEPDNAAASYGLGEVALVERRYGAAIEHFEEALARVPDATRIHYSLAMAHRGLGQLDEARSHLERRGSVGVKPADPLVDALQKLIEGERVHLLRGRLAYQAERFDEAEKAFRAAVEAKPDSTRARVNLGSTLGQRGDIAGAIEQYRAALVTTPDNRAAQYNLGTLLAGNGRHDEAIRHLQSVVEANPDDRLARHELAKSLGTVGQDERALEHYERLATNDLSDEELLLGRAGLLVRMGRFSEALEPLKRAQENFPDRGRTAHALARMLAACPRLELRDGTRALELAQLVYGASQTLGHAKTVALALGELGRCEEAAQWQQRLVSAAKEAGQAELAAELKRERIRYEAGPPCRPPAIADEIR